jgi:hypothetical protein
VPYRLADLDANMADERDEVLLVELTAFGQPGWFSDRSITHILVHDNVYVPMAFVRELVNRKVDMSKRPVRALSRAIYSLCLWNEELLVTLVPTADLAAAQVTID